MRDTSTDIVFAYLDSPQHHCDIGLVSNSHYDEDGLLSMYGLVNPANSQTHRDLMIATSRAGDFAFYSDPDAAKLSFVLAAHADPEISPLDKDIFSGSAAAQVSGLYTAMLERLPDLLEDISGNREYWEAEYAHVRESEEAIARGEVHIDEIPSLDLAIVRIPEHMPAKTVRRYLMRWQRSVHPFAVHNISQCSRLVWIKGASLEAQYRYESWVELTSRRPPPRIDLTGLAEQLCELETAGGKWIFEGVNEVAPRLRLDGSCVSSVPVEDFLARLYDWLRTEPPAWDPYNKPD
jgi:hypothetical protein